MSKTRDDFIHAATAATAAAVVNSLHTQTNPPAEKSFFVAGKEITAKLLAEALHSLPDEKREAVLLYYFFDMNDAEIAKLQNVFDNGIMQSKNF